MELSTYMAGLTPEGKAAFYARLANGREEGPYHSYYIQSICSGARRPSAQLARRIEVASRGKVRGWELRPDVFAEPKSSKTKAKPATTPKKPAPQKRGALEPKRQQKRAPIAA